MKPVCITYYMLLELFALHEHSRETEELEDIRMSNINCSGNESGLSECNYQSYSTCTRNGGRAAVVCTSNYSTVVITIKPFVPTTDVTYENGTVHLIGGGDISRGRVQYCHEGSWYSVCASDIRVEEARAICATLGYYRGPFGKAYIYVYCNLSVVYFISYIRFCWRTQPLITTKNSVRK